MIAEYITTEELQKYLTLEDALINARYQELRKANDHLYIREAKENIRKPFSWVHPFRNRTGTITRYEILEDMNGQARIIDFPATEGFRTAIEPMELRIWINGYLNGTSLMMKAQKEYHPKPKFSVGDLVKVVDADTLKKAQKENGWAISLGAEKYCGCQFAVYDVKYSYAQQTYIYEIGQWGHNVVWFREELLELYKKVEEPVSEYIMSKGEQERLQRQVEESIVRIAFTGKGLLDPNVKQDKPLLEMLEKIKELPMGKVYDTLLDTPADLGVSSNGLPNGMLIYKDKEETK